MRVTSLQISRVCNHIITVQLRQVKLLEHVYSVVVAACFILWKNLVLKLLLVNDVVLSQQDFHSEEKCHSISRERKNCQRAAYLKTLFKNNKC